jgi:ankyrin repeat protein
LQKKSDLKCHSNTLQTLLDHLQSSSSEFRRSPKTFLDAQDPDGNTPLITACIKGHFQVAELLLQRGASVGIQNQKSDGGSALHEAISRRYEHVIGLLLRYHADPFVENIKNYT